MNSKNIKKLIVASLMAALICVATMVIQVPSPMNGYVNLGDCFVIIAAWLLGPIYGGLAGGIGSMLADLLSGYPHYAPGTFIIKGLMGVAVALTYAPLKKVFKNKFLLPHLTTGILAEVIMIAGYFLYASLLLGKGLAAAASIPGNIIQGIFGIICSTVLFGVLLKNKAVMNMVQDN